MHIKLLLSAVLLGALFTSCRKECNIHRVHITGSESMQAYFYNEEYIKASEFILSLNSIEEKNLIKITSFPLDSTDHVLIANTAILDAPLEECNRLFLKSEIVQESYMLTCNRSFLFNEDTISIDSNMFMLETGAYLPVVMSPQLDVKGVIRFYLTNEFFKNSEFIPGNYEFTFEFRTEGGNHIKDEISFDIK